MTVSLPPCFIHIGAPKTGSTAVQKFLYDNRQALLQQDVLYPPVSVRGYGHHDLAFLLAGGYPPWAIAQPRPLAELAAELAAAVRGHRGPLVLSSENFFLFPQPDALRALLADTGVGAERRVIIIVYVRRQDRALEAWYNQIVKAQGYSESFEACVERWRDLWDYRAQLRRWSASFGVENLVVRPFEEAQFAGGSLLLDFLGQIGISAAGLTLPTERVNTGLNKDVLEFQRLVNRLPLTPPEKRRFREQLMALTAQAAGAGLFDDGPLIDGRRRQLILAGYRAGNRDVAATYLHRPALFLDEPGDGEPAGAAAASLTAEKLAYILGWLMARPS